MVYRASMNRPPALAFQLRLSCRGRRVKSWLLQERIEGRASPRGRSSNEASLDMKLQPLLQLKRHLTRQTLSRGEIPAPSSGRLTPRAGRCTQLGFAI